MRCRDPTTYDVDPLVHFRACPSSKNLASAHRSTKGVPFFIVCAFHQWPTRLAKALFKASLTCAPRQVTFTAAYKSQGNLGVSVSPHCFVMRR
jgi:hypothetical protein